MRKTPERIIGLMAQFEPGREFTGYQLCTLTDLGPARLYLALERLRDRGWIVRVTDNSSRVHYRVTPSGYEVVRRGVE